MVNSISFGRKGVFDTVDKNQPQAQTKPSAAVAETKADSVEVGGKKHTAAKVIGGTVATVAVAAGLLALGKHFGAFNVEKVADLTKSFKDKSWISWAKKPVKATLNAFDAAGKFILEKGKAVGEWATNLFKKDKAAAPAPAAEPPVA
ncbi:MAG: hypothetical protein NC200_04475 [Candidatus Gastranaerophilales bacterium]|nr:hypothetical protein [Candidatus Gastranaerophilales bacterium]